MWMAHESGNYYMYLGFLMGRSNPRVPAMINQDRQMKSSVFATIYAAIISSNATQAWTSDRERRSG